MSGFLPSSQATADAGVVAGDASPAGRRDQLVILETGFVYGGRWMQTDTVRFSAGIVLTVSERDTFEFRLPPGAPQRCGVLVTRPHTRRCLLVRDVPAVSIGVSPNHASFRLFRDLAGGGSINLPRELFSAFNRDLQAAYDGDCSLDEARELVERVIAVVVRHLPCPLPRANDQRIRRVLRMLQAEPGAGLDALAEASGLSYDRMSHLFAKEVGMPLRSYQLAHKVHLATQMAGSGMSLTDIALSAGFADSAHFSKVWLKAFGGPPTHFFCSDRVALRSAFHPARATPTA